MARVRATALAQLLLCFVPSAATLSAAHRVPPPCQTFLRADVTLVPVNLALFF